MSKMPSPDATPELKVQLQQQGYCVASQILDAATIEHLQHTANAALTEIDEEHRATNRSQGSLINLSDYPDFSRIIGHQSLATLFEVLGFANPVFSSGYLISKPPHSPALFWHQDWWGWDDDLSYSDAMAQVFLMIYLTDTTPDNGCLRLLPGTHRNRHPLHSADAAHGDELSRVRNPEDPLYKHMDGSVDIPVIAGDVVVGDARLLHGAHANQSEHERSLLTLWFHPDYSMLPAGMQARICEIFDRRGVDTDPQATSTMDAQLSQPAPLPTTLADWPAPNKGEVEHLFPVMQSDAAPHDWNRTPDTTKMKAS